MRIEGTVKDATTGKPIADATLALSIGGHGVARLRTGEQGMFELTSNEEWIGQTVTCEVERRGFQSAKIEMLVQSDPTVVAISLSPGGRVARGWRRWVCWALLGGVLLAAAVAAWLILPAAHVRCPGCGLRIEQAEGREGFIERGPIQPGRPALVAELSFLTVGVTVKPVSRSASMSGLVTGSAVRQSDGKSWFLPGAEVECSPTATGTAVVSFDKVGRAGETYTLYLRVGVPGCDCACDTRTVTIEAVHGDAHH